MSEPTKTGIEFYGGYQVYSESGVDLTQLRENLKRPLSERLERNERMLRFLAELSRSESSTSGKTVANRKGSRPMETEVIIQHLVGSRVAFVLIGGLAMRAQGSAHVTDDFDLCYARTAENMSALALALGPLHPYMRGAPPGLPFKFDLPTIQAGLNFTLSTDAGDLDVLGEVAGVGMYEKCYSQSEQKALFGFSIQVLSLDGLIAAKRAAGRTKDRLHLLELEELKKLRDCAS